MIFIYNNYITMNLIYYYNTKCGSCKDYSSVVDRLSTELKLSCQKRNIEVTEPSHKLIGIPTLILEEDGIELYRSVGNLPYQNLMDEIIGYVK